MSWPGDIARNVDHDTLYKKLMPYMLYEYKVMIEYVYAFRTMWLSRWSCAARALSDMMPRHFGIGRVG